jgi:hypothetical protein
MRKAIDVAVDGFFFGFSRWITPESTAIPGD